ncbi:MAG TPA: TIGR01777 family oxidoreductase [Chthoniobacteraceae bacterium]|nr:TIGR01777 family oxidoreductase [Chthoniobacteraceae bacterium]
MKQKVILAGGSGFLGRSLSPVLFSRGYDVIVLGRGKPRRDGSVEHLQWDGKTLGAWAAGLDGAKAIVNFTGRMVNCRYTAENRREIMDSRVDSVRVLGEAIAQCSTPPEAFVQAGSLAIYGNAGERWCDEEAPHGTGFPVEVCERWEEAFGQVNAPATRKSVLRIGFALGRGGGVIDFLARLTRWFLGGHVGNGRQFISWIHVADLNRMFMQCIEDAQLSGAYNATSPDPVTNAEFMRELRRVLRRPWSPPVPAPIAHLGAWLMGTEASLALTGRRCTPRRFIQHGFTFEFPNLGDALADIYPRS